MAIAGTTKCPSCNAIANVNWKTCLACLQPLGVQAKPQGEIGPQLASMPQPAIGLASLSLGDSVSYRSPQVEGNTLVGWEECCGTIQVIDHRNRMVLIHPQDEPHPWVWINRNLITKKTN